MRSRSALRVVAGIIGARPLDPRCAEVAVFVEFTAAARTDPALAGVARSAAEGAQWFVSRLTARYVATQAVLQPDLVTAETCRQVIDTHLRSLEDAALSGPRL